jgi:outer membrane biosynthesis protein TonB
LVAQEPLTPIEPSPLANEDSTESTAAEASATQEPPLSQFRRHLAERTYNRHIWQTLRNQLMFFRQENRNLRERALDPLRVQLQIDAQGKVVGQEILQTSREPIFDELVLTTAPNLRLAPPDASLVREPPYVVVVQISP